MSVAVAVLWLALASVASARAICGEACRPRTRSAWALADLPAPIRLPPHPELPGDPPVKDQPDTLSPGYRYSTEFDFNLEFVDEFLAMIDEDDREQKQAAAAGDEDDREPTPVQHDPERIDLGSIQDIFTLPDDQLPMYGFTTEPDEAADDDLQRRLDDLLSRTTPPPPLASNAAVVVGPRNEPASIRSSTDESSGVDSDPPPAGDSLQIPPSKIPPLSAAKAPEPICSPEQNLHPNCSTPIPDADPVSCASIVEHSPPPVSCSPTASEIRPQEAKCQAAPHSAPAESCPPAPVVAAQIVHPTISVQVTQKPSPPTAPIAHHQADFVCCAASSPSVESDVWFVQDNDTIPSYLDEDESDAGRDSESLASGSQLGFGSFSTQSSARPSSSATPQPKPASRSKQVSFDDQQPAVVRKAAASTPPSPSPSQQRDGSQGGSIPNPPQGAAGNAPNSAGSNPQTPTNVPPDYSRRPGDAGDVPPQPNYGHAPNSNVIAATFMPTNGMPMQPSMFMLVPATPEAIRLATGQPLAMPAPYPNYEQDLRAPGRTPSNLDQTFPQIAYHPQPPSPRMAPPYPEYERDSRGASRVQSSVDRRHPQTPSHHPPPYPEYERDPRGVGRAQSAKFPPTAYQNLLPPTMRPPNPEFERDPHGLARTRSERRQGPTYHNQMPPPHPDDSRAANRTPPDVDQGPRHSGATGKSAASSGIVLSEYGWSSPVHNPAAVLHNPRDQFTNSELHSLALVGDVSLAYNGVSPAGQSFRQERWNNGLTEYIDSPIDIPGSTSFREPPAAIAQSFQFDVPRQGPGHVRQSPAPFGDSQWRPGANILHRSATTTDYPTRANRREKVIKPIPREPLDNDLYGAPEPLDNDPDGGGIPGKSKNKLFSKKFWTGMWGQKTNTKDGSGKGKHRKSKQ